MNKNKTKNKTKKKRIKKELVFNKIKSHIFPQGKYKIYWEKPDGSWDGECSDPNDRKIYVNPNVGEERFLKILLDEGMHACMFQLDNNFVFDVSDSLSSFLWNIGFRLKKEDGK